MIKEELRRSLHKVLGIQGHLDPWCSTRYEFRARVEEFAIPLSDETVAALARGPGSEIRQYLVYN